MGDIKIKRYRTAVSSLRNLLEENMAILITKILRVCSPVLARELHYVMAHNQRSCTRDLETASREAKDFLYPVKIPSRFLKMKEGR